MAKYENNPLDPRAETRIPIAHGRLSQAPKYRPRYTRHFNFRYNPSSIEVVHDSALNNIDPSALTSVETGNGQVANLWALPYSISFTILLDRFYEASSGGDKGANGVYEDIFHLQKLTGVLTDKGNLMPIQPIPLILNFGRSFRNLMCYCTGLSFAYSHFSTKLVPMRATCLISLVAMSETDPSLSPTGLAAPILTNTAPSRAAAAATTKPGTNSNGVPGLQRPQ